MNHTENYNLPQWETSDRVTREGVNNAMSSIDAAIAGASPLVRLREYTMEADASRFDLSLAGLDVSSYAAVLVVGQPTPGARTGKQIVFYLDNAQTGYLGPNDSDSSAGRSYLDVAELPFMLAFRCTPGDAVTGVTYYYFPRYSYKLYTSTMRVLRAADAISTLNIEAYTTGTTIPAGTRFIVYGLKW